ncbi:MAG: EamA family transporter [bacterium]
MAFVLLFTSIFLALAGQLLSKAGIVRLGGIDFREGRIPLQLWRVFTCPQIVGGLGSFAVSMIFYLAAISRLEISMAYPMVATNYVLVLFFSRIFFREKVNLLRWSGVAFIIAGVVLISRS